MSKASKPFGWTREDRIKALAAVAEAYGDAVYRAFKARHEDREHSTRKRVRAALDVDIEMYRYARGTLEAFSSKDNLEEGFAAEHAFSRNFDWKADKRWNRYFG